jgi:hypothetical protein
MNGRSVNGHVTTVLLSLFRVIVVVAALRQSCSWNEHAVDPFGSWTDRQMYLISEARTQTRRPDQSRAEKILLPPHPSSRSGLFRLQRPFRCSAGSATWQLQGYSYHCPRLGPAGPILPRGLWAVGRETRDKRDSNRAPDRVQGGSVALDATWPMWATHVVDGLELRTRATVDNPIQYRPFFFRIDDPRRRPVVGRLL